MTTPTEQTSILTLVFTDLVNSTALKVEKGDKAAGELLARHRDKVNKLVEEYHGRIVDWSGDGCFLTFTSSSAATYFAIKLQHWHFENPEIPKLRTGIHIGEVTEFHRKDGSGATFDVEGLAVDLSSRIQSLATPNQVLMSEAVFNMVRSRVRAEEFGMRVSWCAHGPYELKGFDDSLGICEIGIEDLSPLSPPESSEKAYRVVSPADEETLGWRPAVGLQVPTRDRWYLKEKLGEGGYGEVWLAVHEKSKAMRVYKYCFDAEHVRSLKREMVLFRLLKETLGHRDDIAELIDWKLDEAPYFLESEYSEGGNLLDWIESKGDLDAVPFETRLELVAQMAVATGAAHSVGVLHKDIKPANILISERGAEKQPQAILTDFGIGLIMNKEALAEQGITMAGFTNTLQTDESYTSGGGTRLYMAPEVVEGRPSTTRSDIFSLGVVLYQLVSGDLTHTIAPGWERDVEDDFLREDIAACVDGQPERRISSADDLAERLRTLEQRRNEHVESARIQRKALQAERRRRQFSLISAIGITITLVVGGIAYNEFQRAESTSKLLFQSEQDRYYEKISSAALLHSEGRIQNARMKLEEAPAGHRNWEWGYLLRNSYSDRFSRPEQIVPMASEPGDTTAVWEKSRGNLIAKLEGHQSEINDLTMIGDDVITVSDDGTARLWNLKEKISVRTFGAGKDPLFCVAVNSNFDLVAAGGFGGGLYVWKISTGESVLAKQMRETEQKINTGSIGAIQISRDGNTLYLAMEDQIIAVEISTGKILNRFEATGHVIAEIIQSPKSAELVSVNLGGSVEHWDEEFESSARTDIRVDSETTTSAVIHVASQRVVTADIAGEISVWNFHSGEFVGTLNGKAANTSHVSGFSPDGTAIVVPDRDKGAKLYDVETGEVLANLIAEDNVFRAAMFHADGRHIFAGTVNGALLIWEPIQDFEDQDHERLAGHTDTVYNANFSKDSQFFATASFDKTVRIWRVDSGEEVEVLKGHDTEVLYVNFSFDGHRLRSYGADHSVILWDTKTFEPIVTLEGDPDGDNLISHDSVRGPVVMGGGALMNSIFDSNNAFFLMNSDDAIMLMDVETGDVLTKYQSDELGVGLFQAISPDGQHFVTTNPDFDLEVIDTRTGNRLHQLSGHTGLLTTPSIGPDNRTLVSASFDQTLRVWDLVNGTLIHTLEGHNAFVVTARFDDTGKRVLSSSGDRTARLWDVESGKELVQFDEHVDMVINAVFSPDYSRVLTYSHDETAKIWDLQGNELLTIDMEKKGGVVYGEWSPDGRTIALVGRGGAVHLLRTILWEDVEDSVTRNEDFQKGIELWIEQSKEDGF